MIPTLKSIFNFNQWKQVQQWVNNKLTLKQDIFNANNTATGATSVTINAKSGVATFTTSVPSSPSVRDYQINNNQVTSSSIVSINMFTDADDSFATIVGVSVGNGIIVININDGGVGNASAPKIAFQILN